MSVPKELLDALHEPYDGKEDIQLFIKRKEEAQLKITQYMKSKIPEMKEQSIKKALIEKEREEEEQKKAKEKELLSQAQEIVKATGDEIDKYKELAHKRYLAFKTDRSHYDPIIDMYNLPYHESEAALTELAKILSIAERKKNKP